MNFHRPIGKEVIDMLQAVIFVAILCLLLHHVVYVSCSPVFADGPCYPSRETPEKTQRCWRMRDPRHLVRPGHFS